MRTVPTLYIAQTADGIGLPLPSYTSRYHVGLNLQAAIPSAMRLEPGERVVVPCGFEIGIPDGYCGQILSNAAMAQAHGLIILGGPQLVHPADRGPLFLLLQNISAKQVVLHRGDVVAQLIICPVVQVAWRDLTRKDSYLAPTTDVDGLVLDAAEVQSEGATEKTPSKRVYKSPRNRFASEEEEE